MSVSDWVRTMVFAARWGEQHLDAPFTSTTQAGCLNPMRVSTDSGESFGVPAGVSLTTLRPECWSTHDLYRAGVVKNLNEVILGDLRRGKSSWCKSVEIARAIEAGRRALVFDRKEQAQDNAQTHGEYLRLAEQILSAVILLSRVPGEGATVNLLDPVLLPQGSDTTMVGQDDLLKMAAELVLGGPLVDQTTQYALDVAHRSALARARTAHRVAVIQDVIDALLDPDESAIPGPMTSNGCRLLEELGVVNKAELVRWGLNLALGLRRFVSGDLSGLIGGETCSASGAPLNLDAPLVVVDTSALPEGSAALAFMMAVMAAYVQARWIRVPGDKTIITEEAYNADLLPGIPTLWRALAKRSGASNTSMVTVLHHLSDLKDGSDMWSLVREAGSALVFQQALVDDASATAAFYSLPASAITTIRQLERGCHLRIIPGNVDYRPEKIQHIRTEEEMSWTNTDQAVWLGR